MALQALVLGFGGTGQSVLTELKEFTVFKYGRVPDSIRFMLFDTIADWKPGMSVKAQGGLVLEQTAKGNEDATSLNPETEYFYLKDHQPRLSNYVSELLNPTGGHPENYSHFKDWLHQPWLNDHLAPAQLNIVDGAAQQRQIGRYAMFVNQANITQKIRNIVKEMSLNAGGSAVNVYLVGSIAGGTGAGCLLDAAYMTRLATAGITTQLNGVLVMPNIYGEVGGISLARSYSLLRELERMQAVNFNRFDAYLKNNVPVTSSVRYDHNGTQTSLVKNRLFDTLFYLGQDCENKAAREIFFASVANSLDPYLDESSGPGLLQDSVNYTRAASSFGSSRIYVPIKLLADLYAWEEVDEFLKGATAPQLGPNKQASALYSGNANDRKNAAKQKAQVLKLFKELLDHAGRTPQEQARFAINTLTARDIVQGWYNFTGTAFDDDVVLAAEARYFRLTYLDPFLSLEKDADVLESERRLVNFDQNKKIKRHKENQEQSRDRFATECESFMRAYTSRGGGKDTFEEGIEYLQKRVRQKLRDKVDRLVIDALNAPDIRFKVDADNPQDGTALTQIYAELEHIVTDNGPMNLMASVIGQFIHAVAEQERDFLPQCSTAINVLKSAKSSGWFGTWVTALQEKTLAVHRDYVQWYQKNELLKAAQTLVLDVKNRFDEWRRVVGSTLNSLTLSIGKGTGSCYYKTREAITTIESRLSRAAKIPTARISLTPGDASMDGYRQHLKANISALALAPGFLSKSRWEASISEDGKCQLGLRVRDGQDYEKVFGDGGSPLGSLHDEIYKFAIDRVNDRLLVTDVLDFLLFLNKPASDIAKALNTADPLITATDVPQKWTLIYAQSDNVAKQNIIAAIVKALKDTHKGEIEEKSNHSETFSIGLLKTVQPSLTQINDIKLCRADYMRRFTGRLINDPNSENDNELYRAQVYHPFRAEMEAWYIERQTFRKKNMTPTEKDLLPPRVVRLLEDPAMMQIFTHCVATGAIEKDAKRNWVWHMPSGKTLTLTDGESLEDPTSNPDADVIHAAVVFVLQKTEGKRDGTTPITFEDAKKSADIFAAKMNLSREERIKQFIESDDEKGLRQFLQTYGPQGDAALLDGLEMVFRFYCDPNTRTSIQSRYQLPFPT